MAGYQVLEAATGEEALRLAESERPDAVVRVKDTGIGIPPNVLPLVFDLFSQADESLERTRGGLGIGLPVLPETGAEERMVAHFQVEAPYVPTAFERRRG
jgi:histidine kinase/DNA gyrase B/HSP90-like ATPase